MVLTVFGGSPKNGAPLLQRGFEEGVSSQHFSLQEVGGVFALGAGGSPEKYLTVWDESLDNLAPIILSEWGNRNNQKFRAEGGDFQFGPIDRIQLRALHSGKRLEVFGVSTFDGASIIQFDEHNGDHQRFRFDLL